MITYPNGLRVVTLPNKATKAATVFVFFGVGSRYETKDINGASHFLEHLFFKGTKKRPTTLDISKELDSVGAEFNAMTSKDWTGYYIKTDSTKIELSMDVLSDMLYNSKFENKEINKERGVIIEEINMYQDNPLMYLEDVLEQVVFKGSTLGWEIAGPRKVIREVSRKKLLDYKETYYVPSNIVIGVAGNVSKTQVALLVKKYFKTEKPVGKPGVMPEETRYKPFVSKQHAPQVKVHYKKTEQVQLGLGFPGYGYFDDRSYALYLLAMILGGSMSSRLFISVRERRGLAYSIRSHTSVYQDTGAILFLAGLDKKRVDEAIKVILSELRKVKRSGVTAAELKQAKDHLRGNLVLRLEDSSSLASWYAKQQLLENRMMTPEQKLKKFDAVTVKDIQNVAKEAFQKDLLNLAVIGPYKNAKHFDSLLSL